MIAAPLLGVVLEMALRDTAQRRAPRGPVARCEVHEQVGSLADEGTGVNGLAGPHAADRDRAASRVDQPAQPPAIADLSASAASALTVPCDSRPSRLR